jgi:hypothetical protein
MSTPANAPAAARPVAVAAVAVVAVKNAVEDPTRRDKAKQLLATLHRVAVGSPAGRASGQPGLPDVEFHGSEGAVVASRQRISADGRPVREVVGVGDNDAAAGQQAAEALGRDAAQPVPGLEVYGDRSMPAASVDDRTTVLESREVVQNGLSTGSPTQRTADSGLGAQPHTGSRVQQPQQDPRTR